MNLSLREISVERNGIFEGVVNGSGKQRLFAFGLLLVGLFLSFESSAQTTQVYNTSGTFTVPAGVTTITVEAWGGGGGGGNSNNTATNGGAGGGGGAYARKVLTGLIPGTTYTVTVGAGGTGAPANSTANATNGEDSQFAGTGITTIIAGGGRLGDGSGENTNGTNGNNSGGNGGTASGGDVNFSGGNGGNGGSASGGGGGSSAATSAAGDNGDNGDGTNADNAGGNVGGNTTDGPGGSGEGSNDNQAGGDGTVPGGGGGGSNDNVNSAGGAGAAGRIVVSYNECALGNQSDYGANSWIGHVYDGANNFASGSYLGRFTETQNFDESFGGDNVTFPLGTSCNVNTETFSVRFRMTLTISAANCGSYPVTIGGDDGVRLSINGGTTWVMNTLYSDHAYTEATQAIYFAAGTYNLVLEYYENQTNNRVSFRIGTTAGEIGSDQTLCQASINPAAFTSITDAGNCSGTTPTYQWQYSSTSDFSSDVNNIPSATGATYDPTTQPAGTRYYRRRARFGGPATEVFSNIVTIIADSPQGDQTTAGNNIWRGYVYDGSDNFTTNYLGYIEEAQTFNETFCGGDCIEFPNGCRFNTTTFSVRYKMTFTPTSGYYTFTIGGDDGVRLSIDGGATYLLDNWGDHGYTEVSSSAITLLAGTYNLVLEYYEAGGDNRVSFSYASAPLPVTWSFFDGYHNDGNNFIDWRTASEKNNFGFVVERSFNGVQFDSVGFVPGNGTTVLPQSYNFVDASPVNGWNYYRLKQIDYDNAFEYSTIIPVFADSNRKPGVYPNPASSSIYISHGASSPASNTQLLNAQTGQTISLEHDEKQPARYPLDRVLSGTYVFSFIVEGKRYSEKVIVVK